MTDPQIVGNPPNQKSLYDVWYAVSNLTVPAPSGDQAIINSATGGKTSINVAGGGKTFSDVVTAIAGLGTPTISGDVAIVNSATAGSTKIKTTPDNPSNLDTSINTLFTTTGIKDATMPSVGVTNTGLSNIDTSLNTLFTSTGIKVATMPSVGVTNTGLSNIDTSLNTLFTSTGIKVATLPDAANAVLTAVEDQATHYLATKGVPSGTIVSGTDASMPANGGSAGVVLTSSQACVEVTIQAPIANTVTVLFGSSASTCVMQLAPGRDFTIPVSNVNKIYVMSSTADTTPVVNWLARA